MKRSLWAVRSVLPGRGLSTGVTLTYLSLIVLIPFAALSLRASSIPLEGYIAIATSPRGSQAIGLSVVSSLLAALLNTVFGVIIAWVIARYRFWGRDLLDAAVDLPFALPTAVAGIALTAVFAPDALIGGVFSGLGMPAAFSRLGVVIALTFVSLPFVVRTVLPVIEELDAEEEEAAAVLGANRLQTFRRVVLPGLLPAALTGFSLSFARALGEYGSVVFISGNLPGRTEVVPFLIMAKLEEYDYDAATALAVVMLLVSFVLLTTFSRVEAALRRRLHMGVGT